MFDCLVIDTVEKQNKTTPKQIAEENEVGEAMKLLQTGSKFLSHPFPLCLFLQNRKYFCGMNE